MSCVRCVRFRSPHSGRGGSQRTRKAQTARDAAFSQAEGDANMQNRRHFLKTGFSFVAAGLAGDRRADGRSQNAGGRGAAGDDLAAAPVWKTARLALRRLTSSTISCATRASPTSAMCPAPMDIAAEYLATRRSGLRPGLFRRQQSSDRRRRAVSCWPGCIRPVSSCSRANRFAASSI